MIMKKRWFAFLFAIAAMFALIPMAASAATQQEAVNWAKSQIGKSIDYDNAYGAQCVDLTKAYYHYLGVGAVLGNGVDYARNALPSGWQRIQYYSGFVAQPGDIAVWTWNALAGNYGHVGIIINADSNGFTTVEQNPGPVSSFARKYSAPNWTFWGVIRPSFSAPPAPPVTEPPATEPPTTEPPATGTWGPWSNWSSTYVSSAPDRQVETRATTVSYNMVVYVTQEAAPPYYRNFRSYSVNGNYAAYGLRSSYGEFHYTKFITKAELDAAPRYNEGDYISQGVLGYQRGRGQSYYFPDNYGWFIESENRVTEYRYRDLIKATIYTVAFCDWDGRILKTQTVEQGQSAAPPGNPYREGYTFTGWDKSYSNVQSNLTVNAQYAENAKTVFTVTFCDWDGQTLKTQTVEQGQSAAPPGNPYREGYTFTGWDKSYSNVQSNLTVNAQYTTDEPPATEPASDVFPQNGHRYDVFDLGVYSWNAAKTYCESLGGYLATISSKEENDYIYGVILSKGYSSAYFGLTDQETESVWKWVTGEPVSYTNWHSDEPNNTHSNENYAMFYWKWSDGTWNDGDFSTGTESGGTAFICEWDEPGSTTTQPSVTEPPATEPPATEPPTPEPPVTEPPASEPPATEPPATEPPATEPAPDVSVNEIAVKAMPAKLSYRLYESLDTAGLTVLVIHDDLSVKTVSDGFLCYPVKFTSEGVQEVTVIYMGKTARFPVDVLADPDQSPLSAVPEKVQVQGTSRGALEFNYDSVLPGGGNRQAFISALLEFQGSLLIFTGGRWYDVNEVTLRNAILSDRVGIHDANGLFVLDNGHVVSAPAGILIDQINASYPLTELPAQTIRALFLIYQSLPPEDQAAIAGEEAIIDLTGAYSQ
jgi:uncharacterized repeat protein (TIGR02543 family)